MPKEPIVIQGLFIHRYRTPTVDWYCVTSKLEEMPPHIPKDQVDGAILIVYDRDRPKEEDNDLPF